MQQCRFFDNGAQYRASGSFGTVRTGGSSLNPYNPFVSESTTESRYVSFGLTWRIGRTEMEAQQTHSKIEPKKKSMANNQ